MFTTKPRAVSPLLDVSMANGSDGCQASKQCFIRSQRWCVWQSQLQKLLQLGRFLLLFGTWRHNFLLFQMVQCDLKLQQSADVKGQPYYPSLEQNVQHILFKQWTGNKLNSFTICDGALINKIWHQVSNLPVAHHCD